MKSMEGDKLFYISVIAIIALVALVALSQSNTSVQHKGEYVLDNGNIVGNAQYSPGSFGFLDASSISTSHRRGAVTMADLSVAEPIEYVR